MPPGHFFEMAKTDAVRAMDIYRNFAKQTDFVVSYLGVARQHQHHTRVEVPKLQHAPVNLGRQLEDYLRDPDFEVHRRQYLAELDAKKSRGGATVIPKFKTNANSKPTSSMATSAATNGSRSAATPQEPRGPAPDPPSPPLRPPPASCPPPPPPFPSPPLP